MVSAWEATQPKELSLYQVSSLDFLIVKKIFLYLFLINCLVYLFNLLFSFISHLNILLLFYFSCDYIVVLIRSIVDFFCLTI